MEEKVTFTAFLKDMMSSSFSKITRAGSTAFSKLDGENRKLERSMLKTGRNIEGLAAKMRKLEETKHLSLDTRQIKAANREIDKLQREINHLDNLGKRGGGLRGFMGGMMGGMIGGALSVGGSAMILQDAIRVSIERQRLKAMLGNTLGSDSEANILIEELKSFATKTPFQVTELTDSFVKLTNQGFKPSMREMRKLGDLASYTGKTFDMLTEAIIDAQVGEFERLKEFGIRAQKHGDMVTFSFRGIQKEVKFTDQSIRDYILSLGDLNGVTGSMDKQMATLGGSVSNLKDNWDNLLESIGNTKAWQNAINGMSSFLSTMNEGMKVTGNIQSSPYISNWQKWRPILTTDLAKGGRIDKLAARSTIIPEMASEWAEHEIEKLKKAFSDTDPAKAVKVLEKIKRRRLFEMVNIKGGRDLSDLDEGDVYGYERLNRYTKRLSELISNPTLIGKQTGATPTLKSPKAKTDKIDDGLSSVQGDNRVVRNLVINIDKQVENINLYNQRPEDSINNFTEQLKRALLTAINDAERIAS